MLPLLLFTSPVLLATKRLLLRSIPPNLPLLTRNILPSLLLLTRSTLLLFIKSLILLHTRITLLLLFIKSLILLLRTRSILLPSPLLLTRSIPLRLQTRSILLRLLLPIRALLSILPRHIQPTTMLSVVYMKN
jgi:hypothetical protein